MQRATSLQIIETSPLSTRRTMVPIRTSMARPPSTSSPTPALTCATQQVTRTDPGADPVTRVMAAPEREVWAGAWVAPARAERRARVAAVQVELAVQVERRVWVELPAPAEPNRAPQALRAHHPHRPRATKADAGAMSQLPHRTHEVSSRCSEW
jgi:hypothetical protein